MNHIPRNITVASYTAPHNAFNSLTGVKLWTSDQGYTAGGFVTSDEWLSDVSGRRTKGMHPCQHYSLKHTISGGSAAGVRHSWVNGVNDADGTWNASYAIPAEVLWTWIYMRAGDVSVGVPNLGSLQAPFTGLDVIGGVSSGENAFCISPFAFPDLVNRGIRALLPGIRSAGGMSLLNSLLELKDFRRLPDTLRNIRRLFEKRRGKYSLLTLARKYPALALKRIAKVAADVFLQKEFNIDPLLSDICGLKTALSDVRHKLSKLVSDASSPQRKHFRCALPLQSLTVSKAFTTSSAYCETSCGLSRSVNYEKKEFNMTLEYSYTLPSGVGKDSLLKALLDRVGVNFNPVIIWNAIPWSFVIDWVLGVNQWLDQFKVRNIEPRLFIRDACASAKVVRTINCQGYWGSQQASSATTESTYNRVTMSSLRPSLLASGVSPHELILGAALVLTR